MATFEAVTTSNEAKIRDPEKLKELLAGYSLGGDVDAEISVGHGKSTLTIYGYDWLDVRRVNDGEDAEEASKEFFDKLKDFLLDGETLDVQMVGNEKCRYPLSAARVKITNKSVKWTGLFAGSYS